MEIMITKTDERTISARNTIKLAKAKQHWAEFSEQEDIFRSVTKRMMWLGCQIGKILIELKEDVGHGRWMLWLCAHFPELGKNDERIVFNAWRCMNIAKMNPDSQNSKNLTVESQRKFMYNYVPVKERPTLEGDAKDSPAPHPLTCVNYFMKWDRQVRTGQIQAESNELLWHDLGPMFLRMAEILGVIRCIEELHKLDNTSQ
jgi:hypothetical protein